MMNICKMTYALYLAIIVLFGGSVGAVEVRSPDGLMSISFEVKDCEDAPARPVYSVRYKGKIVVSESRLGLELEGGRLGDGVTATILSTGSHDTTWKPVYGERSTIRDRYNQAEIQLTETQAPHRIMQLTFRAYDEGVAFCYTIPKQDGMDRVTISKEASEFRFPGDHAAWAVYSAQGPYEEVTLSRIKAGCERPLVIQAADDVYLAVTEARCVDYARMKLSPLSGQGNRLVSDLSSAVAAELPMTTPWRVVMAAGSPGQLLENNDIILNLNAPCAIADTSWIKPGKVIRDVSLTTAGGKRCVDFAVRRCLQYIEYDAGWYGLEYSDESDATTVTLDPKRSKGPLDLHEVIRYAEEHGIGVIVYVNRRALEKQLDEILPLYRQWGIKGVKYGFVNVGSQRWTSWLHEAIRKAADHQLMVDVHDEYRPTGYSRTYPNFMTQEGIRGDEERQPNEMSLTTLFTRMIAGAGDNTICYLDKRVFEQSTHAYQLAKAVCFYSPWQFLYWYDRPEMFSDEPELEFFDHCPTVWDQTKVLEGRIGEYAIMARRSGSNWFLGLMNSGQARTFDVSLDLLDSGRKYIAHIYSDDPTVATRTRVRIDRFAVDRDTILEMSASEKGGQAIRIVPASSEDRYPLYAK